VACEGVYGWGAIARAGGERPRGAPSPPAGPPTKHRRKELNLAHADQSGTANRCGGQGSKHHFMISRSAEGARQVQESSPRIFLRKKDVRTVSSASLCGRRVSLGQEGISEGSEQDVVLGWTLQSPRPQSAASSTHVSASGELEC
jgi:hypothetical protein